VGLVYPQTTICPGATILDVVALLFSVIFPAIYADDRQPISSASHPFVLKDALLPRQFPFERVTIRGFCRPAPAMSPKFDPFARPPGYPPPPFLRSTARRVLQTANPPFPLQLAAKNSKVHQITPNAHCHIVKNWLNDGTSILAVTTGIRSMILVSPS